MSGSEQFGRFRLIERIAVGGMGEVYLARYLTAAGIERLAVVKRILPHLNRDQNFISYFLNEGRITSLLAHPNVVQTIELGRVGNQYYIALEHIPGWTLVRILANAMKHHQLLSIPLVHSLAGQMVGALEYIHNLSSLEGQPLGIIHMDLAPHNVLVTPDGRAKLLDFGISRASGLVRETPRRDFRGRTAYLAPEQLDAQPLDRRVDLFAMGIILHEMLLARPLFRTRLDQHTATRILYAPIPRPRVLRPECPERLEQIVLRALARDRDLRYQDAGEMRADLDLCAKEHGIVSSSTEMRAELATIVPGGAARSAEVPNAGPSGDAFGPIASNSAE